MSKRAAERLNLELTAFIRVDFSDIPFPSSFPPPPFHLTPVFPSVLPLAAGEKYPKAGIHEIYCKGSVPL